MSIIFLIIASLWASIFNFLSVDICNFVFSKNLINFKYLTYLLAIIPVYVFIQRVHTQTQQRSLKSISDEVSKVNDFLIEFIVKYEQVEHESEFDEKTVSELKILKSKINAHLNYLTEYLNEFPYGGPINFVWFFLFDHYLFEEPRRLASTIELEYQELITDETILSLEINFLDGKIKIKSDDDLRYLDLQSIDLIINKGLKLQVHLEENSRKMF